MIRAGIVLCLFLAPCCPAQTVIHVDDDAPAGGDGASWASAYASPHDAFNAARTIKESDALAEVEVRIAEGAYPAVDSGVGDRPFDFAPGARVLGGYAGLTGPEPGFRDPETLVTALIPGSDGRIARTHGSWDEAVVIDGVEFRAASLGEGVHAVDIRGGPVSLVGCSFSDIEATGYSGSVLRIVDPVRRATPIGVVIESCRFINLSHRGGSGDAVVDVRASDVLVEGCAFESITELQGLPTQVFALSVGTRGLWSAGAPPFRMNDCRFSGIEGGGLRHGLWQALGGDPIAVSGTLFEDVAGFGIFAADIKHLGADGVIDIRRCDFVRVGADPKSFAFATDLPRTLSNSEATLRLADSRFRACSGAGLVFAGCDELLIERVRMEGNTTGWTLVETNAENVLVCDTSISGNKVFFNPRRCESVLAPFVLRGTDPGISFVNASVVSNTIDMRNSGCQDNRALLIASQADVFAVVESSILVENRGVNLGFSAPDVPLVRREAGNAPPVLPQDLPLIFRSVYIDADIPIDLAELFADPLGPDELAASGDEDLTPIMGSPMLDAAAPRPEATLDAAGAPRIQNGIVSCAPDVGAFEREGLLCGCVADVNTRNVNPGEPGYGQPDGVVDGADLSRYVELWLAGDLGADLHTINTTPGEPGYGEPDGSVDGADLSFFVEAFIGGCS